MTSLSQRAKKATEKLPPEVRLGKFMTKEKIGLTLPNNLYVVSQDKEGRIILTPFALTDRNLTVVDIP